MALALFGCPQSVLSTDSSFSAPSGRKNCGHFNFTGSWAKINWRTADARANSIVAAKKGKRAELGAILIVGISEMPLPKGGHESLVWRFSEMMPIGGQGIEFGTSRPIPIPTEIRFKLKCNQHKK